MKKAIFCGSRKWGDHLAIRRKIEEVDRRFSKMGEPWMLIEGGAQGADAIAHQEASKLGIPVVTVQANWKHYGRAAGPMRNKWMLALEPDLVVAFPVSDSVGTLHMVEVAKAQGVHTYVHAF